MYTSLPLKSPRLSPTIGSPQAKMRRFAADQTYFLLKYLTDPGILYPQAEGIIFFVGVVT